MFRSSFTEVHTLCLTFFVAFLVSAFTAAAWFFLVPFATLVAAFFAMILVI